MAARRQALATTGRPENRLLFAAALPAQSASMVFEHERALDWDYVVRAAECQGIAPLLWEFLPTLSTVHAPAEISNRLQSGYWATHFRARRLLAELDRIGREALPAGLAVMPLKGAALATRWYPRPALRPMSDIDLLIPTHQLASFTALLQGMGYRDYSKTVSYLPPHRLDPSSDEHQFVLYEADLAITVEFRAEPLEPAVCRLADLDHDLAAALQTHVGKIWNRSRCEHASAAGIHAMSREDLILHVAAHLAARHAEFRLIWLHDLGRLINGGFGDVDWSYVSAAARRFRIDGAVRSALWAAAQYAGAAVSPAVLSQFGDDTTIRTALGRWEYRSLLRQAIELGRADLTHEGPCLWRFPAALSRVRGWRPRLRALLWAVLPARTYLAQWREQPARPRPLDYAAACMSRYAAMVRRAVRGEPVRPWRSARTRPAPPAAR